MKAALLIPTYNRSGLLRRALSKALAQDYGDLEILVCDNASTDDTPDVEREFRDPRLRWHRNPTNLGLAGNWRRLMYELTDADYVKILPDDDYLADPAHTSRAMALARELGAGAVFSGCAAETADGRLEDLSLDAPERLDPRWWLDHLGGRIGGRVVFPNLTTGGFYHLRLARDWKAYIDPVFGMDYELAFKFMLNGPTGHLRGAQCVEGHHASNDGRLAPLDVVVTGLKLFDRVRDFALGLGFKEPELEGFLRRGRDVFVQSFLVRAWTRDRGRGPSSLVSLYRTLGAVDPDLARQTFFHPTRAARLANADAYEAGRRLFRRWVPVR